MTVALRNRAWGRPGSRTIPVGWDAQHAPAAAKIFDADVALWPIPSATTPGLDPDTLEPLPAPAPVAVWTGRGKVSAMSTQRRVQVLGEQAVTIAAFDVELPRDTTPPPVGTPVTVVADTDPSLTGRTLYVVDVQRGDARFGRHLTCVDDLTAISSEGA